MPDPTRSQPPKLLQAIRTVLRLHHSSIHTERASRAWVVRFMRFHRLRSRADLFPAAPKSEAFLTDPAVHGHIAAATPNPAMHALVCLSKRVLHHPLEDRIHAIRADNKVTVPVVMTRDAVAAIIALLEGTPSVMHKALKAAVRRAGLTQHLSAHPFRHACATHLLHRGTAIRTMQHLLGHNDVATTMIATHVLQQGGQDVPRPLDDLGV